MKKKQDFMGCYKNRYDTSDGFGNAKEWKNSFYKRMSGEEAEQIIKETKESPYTILGIELGASQVEIKAAFRRLIQIWHPDKNPHNIEEAEVMSKKIIAAYTVLLSKK